MSWRDPDDSRGFGSHSDGRSGGLGRGGMRGWMGQSGYGQGGSGGMLRRVFGDGENPLTWAVPLYTAWGILVRIHLVLILFTLGRILWSLFNDTSVIIMVGWMASLWVLILLHEYGHCLAARRVGGDADEIILWPLGGLAMCQVPERWDANLIVALAGPAVNVALFPVFALAIWMSTGDPSLMLFNPIRPEQALTSPSLYSGSSGATLAKQLLIAAHQTNFYLLAFNMLVPMFPMDAGRVVHAVLWRSRGRFEATTLAARGGIFIALLMIVAGLVVNHITLVAIGLFGGVMCWQELRVQRFEADPIMASISFKAEDLEPSPRELKEEERREQQEKEVDRILAKISAEGMGALTAKEKKTLAKASEARRKP